MTTTSATERYALPVIVLHWLMFLLIAAAYVTVEVGEDMAKESAGRASLEWLHYVLGLSVLALVVVRILARLSSPTPPILPPLPQWQKLSSRAVHLALLVFMIVMPVTGWLILGAEGKTVLILGFELPALIGPSEELEDVLEEVHEVGGNIGYALIGLHAAAALFHHYVQKDNTLRRMLPGG